MTCSSIFSSASVLREPLRGKPLSQEDLTTRWTHPASRTYAASAGKSTLVRQWYELMAVRHLGEQSRLVAKGALPHSSTKILQAVSTSR